MKTNLMTRAAFVILSSFLISCASTDSASEGQIAGEETTMPIADVSIMPDQEAAPAGATSEAVQQGQAAGDFPGDLPPAQVPPGAEQVAVDEKLPDLKPVHPVSSWTAKSSASASEPKDRSYDRPEKKLSKKAALKAKKSAALAKKSKKSKGLAKKLSKAECKKFAKAPKKHKKQIAQCKIEKKKTAAKAKKSAKIARR